MIGWKKEGKPSKIRRDALVFPITKAGRFGAVDTAEFFWGFFFFGFFTVTEAAPLSRFG